MKRLNLDLTASEAKLARSRDHLETLEREVPADVSKDSPYGLRISEVDPHTGWCEISLAPRNSRKPRPSVVLGDVVHNLRSALDYVITSLADASGVATTSRHQFPIFRTEEGYLKRVIKKKDGLLQGIRYGLDLIEQVQPYHLKPDPRQDPLWHIHRFNNADKHRQPVPLLVIPQSQHPIQLHFNGIPAETDSVLTIDNWSPNEEYVIHRIRFDPPYAYNFRAEGPIELRIQFETPAFESEPAHAISLVTLRGCHNHVTRLIEAFKLL